MAPRSTLRCASTEHGAVRAVGHRAPTGVGREDLARLAYEHPVQPPARPPVQKKKKKTVNCSLPFLSRNAGRERGRHDGERERERRGPGVLST
eukprot:3940754-Rhodomonas_salina.2